MGECPMRKRRELERTRSRTKADFVEKDADDSVRRVNAFRGCCCCPCLLPRDDKAATRGTCCCRCCCHGLSWSSLLLLVRVLLLVLMLVVRRRTSIASLPWCERRGGEDAMMTWMVGGCVGGASRFSCPIKCSCWLRCAALALPVVIVDDDCGVCEKAGR